MCTYITFLLVTTVGFTLCRTSGDYAKELLVPRQTSPPFQELSTYVGNSIVSPSLFPNVPPTIHFLPYDLHPGPSQVDGLWWGAGIPLLNGILRATGFELFQSEPFCPWIPPQQKSQNTFPTSPNISDILSPEEVGKQDSFPGTADILSEKHYIVFYWRKFVKRYPCQDSSFHLESYILPHEIQDWRNALGNSTWIFKPTGGVESLGISLVSSQEDEKLLSAKSGIVQKYLVNPFLFHERKVEVRTYVLVTGFNPLKIFLFPDGVITLGREPFLKDGYNYDCGYVLRTPCRNFKNLEEDKFFRSMGMELDDNGASWQWENSRFFHTLRVMGLRDEVTKAQGLMEDIIVKTLLSTRDAVLDKISSSQTPWTRYSGMQLLGIDFHFQNDLKPLLLEVNVFPAMYVGDHTIQSRVRLPLFQDLMNIAGFHFPQSLSLDDRQVIGLGEDLPLFDKRLYEYPEAVAYNPDLDKLTSDDVRVLVQSEDELKRASVFKKIFPTKDSSRYLGFMNPHSSYYERLITLWERRFAGGKHEEGVSLLRRLTMKKYHLHPNR